MKNIALIGMSGAGKSMVGAELARLADARHVDVDRVIENEADATLPEIIAQEGEAAFLARESTALRHFATETGLVLSTGGSAVLVPETMGALAGWGIVYLRVPFSVIQERIGAGAERGIIGIGSRTLADVFSEREPLYARYATHVVDASEGTPADIAARVLSAISSAS